MTRKFAVSVLFVLGLGLMALMGVTAGSPGQNSQRGECEQKCTQTYQACRAATNANQADCKRAFDACRAACKDVKPHPTPTPETTPSPTPETTPSPTPETTPNPTPEATPSPTPTPHTTPGPSQRGECEQKCTETYQACRGESNANQADCKRAFDSCRAACKDVSPHPTPSPTPETTPSPTAGR